MKKNFEEDRSEKLKRIATMNNHRKKSVTNRKLKAVLYAIAIFILIGASSCATQGIGGGRYPSQTQRCACGLSMGHSGDHASYRPSVATVFKL